MARDDLENELKKRLLPRPPTPPAAALPLRPPSPAIAQKIGPVPGRPVLATGDTKKKAHVRSWIKIDSMGNVQTMEVNKSAIMRRCELPARDLRLLDPVFVYPSTILGRERAIVVNLEQIRCIITADEVLLLNTTDENNVAARYVEEYKSELMRRVRGGTHTPPSESSRFHWRGIGGQMAPTEHDGPPSERAIAIATSEIDHAGYLQRRVLSDLDMFSGSGSLGEELPFEFKALELALEAACSFLDSQARDLGREAYPLLEQLAYHISTRNLELVRKLKSNLVALTRRVQKVRDEIEQLMDDDGDMAEMYLTEKKGIRESNFSSHGGDHHLPTAFGSLATPGSLAAGGSSFSAPVSPVGSPSKSRSSSHLDVDSAFRRAQSFASQHSQHSSSNESVSNVEELEMLLEAYFVVIDGTLNKLTALSQYIDDTEDFINIQLDNVRNQLIQYELLLTTATFVVAIYGVVAGIFGMNVPIGLESNPYAFKWVLIITGIVGAVIFAFFLWYFRYKNWNIV